MKKRLNDWLNIIIGAVFGAFLGHGIFAYWEYRAYPGLYTLSSAPWYRSVLLQGIFTAVILLLLALIKWFLKKR